MNKIQYRRLGKTNLRVSEIGAGCWAIGGLFSNLGLGAGWSGTNLRDIKEGLMKTLELGCNLFDTADVYGLGQSERMLGWMLVEAKKRGICNREDLIIVSKTGYFSGCAPHGYDPLQMTHQLEMSLQNLGTDYIDVYFLHHLDFGAQDQYLQAAIEKLQEFKQKGYIKHIGLRGPHKYSLYRFNESINSKQDAYSRFQYIASKVNPAVIGIRYNMLSHSYNVEGKDIFAWADANDVGILTYKPLGQGLLLNKYNSKYPPKFEPGDHRKHKAWFQVEGLEALEKRILNLADRFGCKGSKDLAQLAIRYCLSRSNNSCTLVGFKDAFQIEETLTTRGRLTLEEQFEIQEIFSDLKQELGSFFSKS